MPMRWLLNALVKISTSKGPAHTVTVPAIAYSPKNSPLRPGGARWTSMDRLDEMLAVAVIATIVMVPR